jgi:hypothetical protein
VVFARSSINSVVDLKMFETVFEDFKENYFLMICCMFSHSFRFKSSMSAFCRAGITVDHFTPKLHFINKFSVDFMVLNLSGCVVGLKMKHSKR